MQLDYNSGNSTFVLRVNRREKIDPMKLVTEHGLDFSRSASTGDTAVLFTDTPYAVVAFAAHATPAARAELAPLLERIEASWAPDAQGHFDVPADKELWPFQRASVRYVLTTKHALIGDQPGLGKTPMAVTVANTLQAERILVVVPAALRLQWANKIREWMTTGWATTIHPILSATNGVNPSANWTIVSYDLARTEGIGKALARGRYDLLILDEAHYCKSVDALRTRALFGGGRHRSFEPIAERAERILALTGTPLPNRPREAYVLARSLCWDSIDWASEDAFRDRFNPSRQMPNGYIDERTGRHAELQARMRACFMARHLKRDVMPQLQMPQFDLVQAEETGPVKQALQAESLLEIDPEDLAGADAETLGHVSVVRRMMGIALAPQVVKYVDMLIDGGEEKLVVFAHHIEVLDILERGLKHRGVVRVDGRTSSKQKEHYIGQFQTNPKVQVIIGHLLSLGTGTDGLQQVAWHAIIAEPSWVPGENVQAFDRLDRGGQTRTVLGEVFVAPASFAEKVLASALRKMQVVHKALDHR